MFPEKDLELVLLFADRLTERDQRRCLPHLVHTVRTMLGDQGLASLCQIQDQRIDHATNRLVDQPPVRQLRVLSARGFEVVCEDTH